MNALDRIKATDPILAKAVLANWNTVLISAAITLLGLVAGLTALWTGRYVEALLLLILGELVDICTRVRVAVAKGVLDASDIAENRFDIVEKGK